jgi:hypothetical protein
VALELWNQSEIASLYPERGKMFAAMKRQAVRTVRAMAFLSLFLSPTLAGPLDITDSDKIGYIIAKFRQALSELIALAGGEAGVTLMLGYQQTDATLQSLSVTYDDSLQTTFASLDVQRERETP